MLAPDFVIDRSMSDSSTGGKNPGYHKSLLRLLLQLWVFLSPRRRAQLGSALLLMLASSMAEVVSLTAGLPFLAVLANPSEVWSHQIVQQLATRFGLNSFQDLLLPISLAFAVTAVLAGVIRLLTLWINGVLAAGIGSDLSCEAYRRTLYQPYAVQVSNNSSVLIASISTDVNQVISSVLNPLLLLLSSTLIVLGLVTTLVVIDWAIALGTGLLITLVYVIAMIFGKRPLQKLGQRQVVLNRRLIQSLQEGLGAIRDVLLSGNQRFYCDIYEQADQSLRRAQAQSSFLSTYPRLILEPAGMALIAIVGYFIAVNGDVYRALPLLGTLALGAQRLLPMAQKIYESWAQTRAAKDSLANVLSLLSQPLPEYALFQTAQPLELREGIRIEHLHFRYAKGMQEILQGLDLAIVRGERIGIIGSTGSGKTTLIDLLMGLLHPTEGRILVDGADLHDPHFPELLPAWRAAIAHVPQSIYLADSSISENIAFGIPKDEIDLVRVRQAAHQAQISSFIENSPKGYDTCVGERGICLSGGQRQRIGIARALYKRAKLLVLDEATSALDNATEQALMESVEDLSRELTIVMIAHRLSTVARCDRVIRLNKGRVVTDGPPKLVL